jgi:(1->4)-alpha-D-glucan 1-alpha-D-glucosylmutase
MTDPIASYRLQLTPTLGFRDAIGLLDHLTTLGVSHLYVSPITEAVPGSPHGYDVVDHTMVRSELGGDDALAELLDALAARGMSLLVDHVPNHVSVARPELNAPWWEMLRDGPHSAGARWFDVDQLDEQRVIVPILAEPLEEMIAAGRLAVDGDVLVVDDAVRLPLAADTAHLPLAELVERQHYRLQWWRSPERNVRRFFTIDDLVAVRVEDPDVVAVVDALPCRLGAHVGFGGVRVDHLDGLADPAAYLDQLRVRLGAAAWIVAEKILAPGETLPSAWPVDGTTGYEFARLVDHLLLDPDAGPAFDRLWIGVTGDQRPFHAIEDQARREVLRGGLLPDVDRTVKAAAQAIGDHDDLRTALVELTVALPRYRTYLPADPVGRSVLAEAGRVAAAAVPDAAATVHRLVAALLAPTTPEGHQLRTRWQQLTGPAMAKGAEDRAFYRYLRLASTCEVGGDGGSFGVSVDAFHRHLSLVDTRWPRTMSTASTHDTKRSHHVRARSAALTAVADDWLAAADRWTAQLIALVPGLPPVTALLALQTVVTCPGLDPSRLTGYLVKAAREADLYTSWTDPDDAHEARCAAVATALLGGSDLAVDVAAWSRRLDLPGTRAALVATCLRTTVPGVPDIFQGTEVPSFRLVDPDNRIDPDWSAVRRIVVSARGLDGPTALVEQPDAAEAVVLLRTLALRRRRPESFGPATYRPLVPEGADADDYVAFARGDDVIVVTDRRTTRPDRPVAPGSAELELPPGTWRDVLDDASSPSAGGVELARMVAGFPAVVLERVSRTR